MFKHYDKGDLEKSILCGYTECYKINTIAIELHKQTRILSNTHAQSGVLSVVACKVQNAFCSHSQSCVLGQTRYPVLMFV